MTHLTHEGSRLDRTASKTDADGDTTRYSYLGLSSEVLTEDVAGQLAKSYQYSPWGQRLSQVTYPGAPDEGDGDGSPEIGTTYYGYNAHTDVETLTDENGDTVATYGYTAYGDDDASEFTGADKPQAGEPQAELVPFNAYRYNSKRWDSSSGKYDMGFRDYDPRLNRFTTRDMYNSALADMELGADPYTGNRYAFTGGNPINRIEHDGHEPRPWHEEGTGFGSFEFADEREFDGAPKVIGKKSSPDAFDDQAAEERASDEIDERVKEADRDAAKDEAAWKAVVRDTWDAFLDSSRYIRQGSGIASPLITFADYCNLYSCGAEGWSFYEDPAFWLAVGNTTTEELWSTLGGAAVGAAGAAAGAVVGIRFGGLWGAAIGGVAGGTVGAGVGSMGAGAAAAWVNGQTARRLREDGVID